MIKNKIVALILFIIFFLLFWNDVDYLYSSIITGSDSQFAKEADRFIPFVVTAAVGALVFLLDRKR